MEGDEAMVGNNLGSVPGIIEKSALDNVIMIAAGRFHTIAIRRQNAGDSVKFEEEDEEEEDDQDGVDSEEKDLAMPEDDGGEKMKIDVKHDVFAWGRGYHGQLGLRDLKLVQLTPKRVKIRRFPALQEHDQATRIANV